MTTRKAILFTLTLVFTLLFSQTAFAKEDISVHLNNQQVQFTDAEPVIKNGRTLIPVRKVFTEAGANVQWHEATRTVQVQLEGKTIEMHIGDSLIKKESTNNSIEHFRTDVPSQIINSRTYIPLRITGELLGYKVVWDNDNRIAALSENENGESTHFSSEVHKFELEVLELVNQERKKAGISPLQLDKELSTVAREKSRDMLINGYFSHTSPTYGTPFDMMNQFNISYRLAGENIAAGQVTPGSVMEGWMNSAGHRKNILNQGYTHLGVGFVEGNQGYKYYWTQMFKSR